MLGNKQQEPKPSFNPAERLVSLSTYVIIRPKKLQQGEEGYDSKMILPISYFPLG